jgi:hypothetical protein
MVSGLFSAKTVVHLSTTPATASFEHAVAVCTETPALNMSTMALIPRRVCIISSFISSATSHQYQLTSLLAAGSAEETRCGRMCKRPRYHRAADVMNLRRLMGCLNPRIAPYHIVVGMPRCASQQNCRDNGR